VARSFTRTLVLCLAVFIVSAAVAPVAARDLATMNGDEIRLLQQRLADAACYRGPADGRSSAALEAAQKACPDQEPSLRIETGMHVAQVWRIGGDAQCRIAATGSDDKTVRLWSMPDGQLLRTQRLPIGSGNNGRIFAVAVSPDGRQVAAGGWDAHYPYDSRNGVYLFDAATGTSLRRIGSFENVINHIAFSGDGRRLAVALGGNQGIRVFDTASGQEIMADRDFGDNSYGVAFGPDGTLYASGYDGFVRRYSPDLRLAAKIAAAGGKRVHAIAVDSTGRHLAIGYDDSANADILDPISLRRVVAVDSKGITNGNLFSVAWSRDGSRLVAAGRAQVFTDGVWHVLLRAWTPDGRRVGSDAPASDNTIQSLTSCGDAIAFGAADPAFGLWRTDGTTVTLQKGRVFDARGKVGTGFTISPDAMRVTFGLAYSDDTPVLFDLAAGKLTDAPAPIPGFLQPNVTNLNVADWRNLYKPLYKGRPITLEKYETSRSLAVRDDRAGFVLGTDYHLRTFNANGQELWNSPAPSVAWGVNLAKDGEVIAAAYYDGTVRWHRWSDGQELLALFVDKISRRWVAWTPSGYYMASPGGEDLIGWHVNRGWEQPADFFRASRFRDRFNRPDIVQSVLDTLDEATAVREANLKAHRREEAKPIEATLPPVIKITAPSNDGTFSDQKVNLTYTLRSPSGLPVDKVIVLIDGSPTGAQARGLDATAATSELQQTITIGLPQRDVEVGLVAKSGAVVSEVAHVKLTYRGTSQVATQEDLTKPMLYALLVGVANYQDPKLHLEYSAKDAEELAAAFKTQAGGLYRDVKVKVLTDKDATVTGVKDGLLWLQKETTSRDLAIVFLAGHGLTDAKNEFWYLPYEADPTRLLSTAVSRTDVMGVLRDLPGKKILFIDACHAGAMLASNTHTRGASVDLNSAINDFATADSGLVVYGAATGRELSVESDQWHHGAFTKALIEAIGEGKADIAHKGRITTSLLDAYLAERVKTLTDGEQHPVMSRPDAVPDFPLALVK
jgi:WD40 repeat protein